ncbi:hypothetical protein BD779DRAFT_1472138 [Infundibulicybe gibba]|nr:hypothetical protein BD779DRAFT_1472138 [Infundibulicybe gibba]
MERQTANILQDQQLAKLDHLAERQDQIQERNSTMLRYLVACTSNDQTLSWNSRQIGSHCRYKPLQKTVPGDGFTLALQAAHGLHPTIQQAIAALNPPPPVGSLPTTFKPDVTDYDHLDILNLIVFYNQDFEILPNDSIATRIKKLQWFLTML